MPNVDHIFNTPRQATFNPVVSTQVFPLPFPIYAASSQNELNGDFLVTVNSVVATGYTISGTFIDGVALDGSLSLAAGVSGVTVQVWSRRAPRTSQDLNDGGTVTPAELQAMFNSVITSQRDIFDWLTNLQTGSPFIPVGTYLPTAGGTMIGDLNLAGDPTTNLKAATKQYVDNKFGGAQTWGGLGAFNAGLLASAATISGLLQLNGALALEEQALVDGANISWDMSASPNASITLGGNRTLIAPTLAKRSLGQIGFFTVIMDGTGNRSLALDATFKVIGDPQLRQNPGDTTVFFYKDLAGNVGGNNTILLFPMGAPAAPVLLNTLTASNSVSLQDTTSFTSAYRYYRIVFENVVPVTNNSSMLLQPQVGGSFQTVVTAMVTMTNPSNAGSSSLTQVVQNTTGTFTDAMSNTAGGGFTGEMLLANPAGTANYKNMGFFGSSFSTASAFSAEQGGVGYVGSQAALTGLKFLMSAGNISTGTIKIYGWN